ncbi:hypothetical protein [Motilibacter deserti]|uniref:Uncharacterized protein n=1 Tax=Motilibacter deserti TaxID=2714956 RepID=A0ABX0GUG7_9ACTN|nr:hypothetical protein [Motilibacter deserti]NHC12933.1 hypothetical protein [Motilibacter deserti]
MPVWMLERTRVPIGTELRRLGADGSDQLLAVFHGLAVGWRGAAGYFPPLHLVGPRATWRGLDLPAALVPGSSTLELVSVGEAAPLPGFEPVRPQVWRAVAPLADVDEVFELVLACRWHGARARIVLHSAGQARLLLLEDDPGLIAALAGEEVEPGVFEVTAPRAELTDVGGTTQELARD